MNLESLTETQLDQLAEKCEDFLLHRHIPLRSHARDIIISHAIKEGFKLVKFTCDT